MPPADTVKGWSQARAGPAPTYSEARMNQGRGASDGCARTNVVQTLARRCANASQGDDDPCALSSPFPLSVRTIVSSAIGSRQNRPPYPAPGRPLVAGLANLRAP